VARLRAELLRTVTPKDLREVVAALLNQAKAGSNAIVRRSGRKEAAGVAG